MKVLAIILGAVLLIVAVRGTATDSSAGAADGKGLWPLLKNDLESQQLRAWVAAIVIIGLLGYVPDLKPIANSILALLIIVLLLSKGKFFDQLQQAILKPAGKAA